MAEIENKEAFAGALSHAVGEARRRHQGGRKGPHAPAGESPGAGSYIESLSARIGVSANTLKSWMGQMGERYVPGRIEDGKLFGVLWWLLVDGELEVDWFLQVLRTTSLPVLEPPVPLWISSCLHKAKIAGPDGSFGPPGEEALQPLLERLFGDFQPATPARPVAEPVRHNLPARWSQRFVGRRQDLEAIRRWMHSACPVCLVTGWGGIGKTATMLEAAYRCCGDEGEIGHAAPSGQSRRATDALGHSGISSDNRGRTDAEAPVGETGFEDIPAGWPRYDIIAWTTAERTGLCLGNLLDTIAYLLGRVELMDISLVEKRHVVTNALARKAREGGVLLLLDSIDQAEPAVFEFVMTLPEGVSVLATSREQQGLEGEDPLSGACFIPLEGLIREDAFAYFAQEVQRQILTSNSARRRERFEQMLHESHRELGRMIDATAGNPKAISLVLAHVSESDAPLEQITEEIEQAAYSFGSLFEYLFGRSWKHVGEDAQLAWQALCVFGQAPDAAAWAAVCGLDARRFHHAVELLRASSLVEPWREELPVSDALVETEEGVPAPQEDAGTLLYRWHPMVVAYAGHRLAEDADLVWTLQSNWVAWCLRMLERELAREAPDHPYWRYLLGRDASRVRRQWPNLLKLLEWAADYGQDTTLVALMMRLSHQLGSYSYPLRIHFGRKAADAAARIGEPLKEALLRLDTVGWACLEIGDYDQGLGQIEEALRSLSGMSREEGEVVSLQRLGLVFKARFYLKMHLHEQARTLLEQARDLPSDEVVHHRLLLTWGDLAFLSGQEAQAVSLYEEAVAVCRRYGGEYTAEHYSYLAIAYLRLGDLEKGESILRGMAETLARTNQLEQVHFLFGSAELEAAKGHVLLARSMVGEALAMTDAWERKGDLPDLLRGLEARL